MYWPAARRVSRSRGLGDPRSVIESQQVRPTHDERRDLWRSFLEVVQLARPRAVVMENVPDMALDREMFILRSMTEELEQIGYSVSARVVDSWCYGSPDAAASAPVAIKERHQVRVAGRIRPNV